MIGIRERRFGSWLDRASAIVLGCIQGHLLWERCKGQEGIFITLTYNHYAFADAWDCYRCQSEKKHVARFFQRLSKRLGRSFKGQWIRKMEFQENGWVHWHIVLLGEKFIPNKLIEECWTHGFTKTKKITKSRCRYLSKYVTKAGCGLPPFIEGEKPKSVKIFACSPGFWGDLKPKKTSGDCPIYKKYGPWRPSPLPVYTPIGQKMRQGRGCSVAKHGAPGCKPSGVYCTPAKLERLLPLVASEARSQSHGQGWLWFDIDQERLDYLIAAAVSGEHRSVEPTERSRTRPPRSGGLNLRGTRNRAPDLSWLHDWWVHEATHFDVDREPTDSDCWASAV